MPHPHTSGTHEVELTGGRAAALMLAGALAVSLAIALALGSAGIIPRDDAPDAQAASEAASAARRETVLTESSTARAGGTPAPTGASASAGATGGTGNGGATEGDADTGTAPVIDLTLADLDALPSSTAVEAVSLAGGTDRSGSPTLTEGHRAAIEQALARVSELGDAGFVLVDTASGGAIVYNADASIYGASSFKAPYALYVCETLVETGALSLDDRISTLLGASGIPISSTSAWAAYGSASVRDLIAAAVVHSDNDAFGALRNAFDQQGFDDWVRGAGAADCVFDPWSWYPTYCARSAAKLWCEMLAYRESGSETAAWLYDLCGQTATSFLRDALADSGAEVHDKAGWIADADPAWCAIADAGIVELDGRTYLVSIMTGMADTADARERFIALADALFAAREDIA